MAARNGISPAYLSQIESGLANPTLRTLVQIATALDTEVAQLLGAPDAVQGAPFRPYLSTAPLATREHAGTGIWNLTAPGSRRLRARLVQGDPVGHTEPTTHAGEELLVVMNGSCRLHVDGASYLIAAGDVCHFSATETHHLSAMTPDLTLCVVLSEE
jgi:quercetin dioxygenase-like cupin family protein